MAALFVRVSLDPYIRSAGPVAQLPVDGAISSLLAALWTTYIDLWQLDVFTLFSFSIGMPSC